jgi:uncharacterized Zn finger protein (UPF0148 family)
MALTTCPQCGGRLESRTAGEWHEKVLVCPYCSHRISVPGEVEIRRHEEEATPGGYKRVDVQVKRRDLDSQDPKAAEEAKQVIEELKKKAGLPAHGKFPFDPEHAGAGVTVTEAGPGGLPPQVQELLRKAQALAGGKGGGPVDLEEVLRGGSISGKDQVFTKKVVTVQTSVTDGTGASRGPAPSAPLGAETANPVALVKWLVILAVVVAVIVVLVKFF